MKIAAAASDVFEAFVDTEKMSHFWFSSGSGRWTEGETVTLRYEEYNAQVDIKVVEIQENKKIVYAWGDTTVTITMEEVDPAVTIIAVNEDGFNEKDDDLLSKMIDNKEGWVYMLTCLKGYLEYGVSLRAALVK
ncbi:hypothetical protein CBW65_01920 [Tumebacillus avium]|uniref:Activator of Hsp90 ATPase homologue 1/2-like C-terminal domain-containing protein n=2 Tax=Tumebacillus avium TaxID=1903704 RepID=A0A1Y0ITH9_9BACL|nr:hypothetical protein CBW65_01920 [Tumebacillus avium]